MLSVLKLKAVGLVLFPATLLRQTQLSPTAVIEMGCLAMITAHPLATDGSIAKTTHDVRNAVCPRLCDESSIYMYI